MSETAFDHAARLTAMAKQIADFFRVYPEERAVASIAEHINHFWTRRMRADLLSAPASALDPLVVKARALVKPGS